MRTCIKLASAAFLALPMAVRAAVPVEQIEAYEVDTGDDPNNPTRYAAVNFNTSSSITILPGQLGNAFPNITFHAVDTALETTTDSSHAYTVGALMYGINSVALGDVSDVYSDAYDDFLNNVVQTQDNPGENPTTVPGHFASGAKVINNSYIVDYGTTAPIPADTDALRRIDFMINRDDVTFVAAAETNTGDSSMYTLDWASFNALAVSGAATFNPAISPGKQHADLYLPGQPSFGAAQVSGFAAALYSHAVGASQTDAEHGATLRSLLMAGANKIGYTRQTTNNLSLTEGAGEPVYDNSLAILQGGKKALLTVASNAVTGTPNTDQQGWTYGSITANSKNVVLFQPANNITGVTASLNWNVDISHTATTIDTSTVIFPNLALTVYPATLSGGTYTLGTALTTTGLSSSTSGDNVQYLYSTGTLSAGSTYAFVITDTNNVATSAALSYIFAGSFASQWNVSGGSSWGTASNWTNGIPNAQGAQANFLSSPGLTAAGSITLDGDRTVGQITFNNSHGYTIAQGTVPLNTPNAGSLTIDDTGDSSGTANPLIIVSSGSQAITAPVILANGVTVNTAASTSLNISGAITGSGGLTKSGIGTLTLSAAGSFGNTTINAGTLTLAPAGSIASGIVNVNSGGTLNFAASTAAGILARTVVPVVNINSGGTVTLALPTIHSTRQILVTTGGLTIAGTTNNWSGKLDLSTNDLDDPSGSLATITNQIKQGFAGGSWNGNGITSSGAAANTSHLTTLGVILNSNGSSQALYGSGTTLGMFDGQNPGPNDVLVKYTYYGDANLDGQVDGSDYTLIDNGFHNHLTGWINGDFNYDGVIDGSDYTLIDNAFNMQGGSLATNNAGLIATVETSIASSAVPEPASCGLLLIGGILLAKRQRRYRALAPIVRRIIC